MNDDSHGTYNISDQITLKTQMLKSRLCNYSDAYILVSGTTTVPNILTTAVHNNRKKNNN